MQIEGIVKSVSKQSNGRNAKGDWTMQWVEFVDGRRVKVWTRPDLSTAVNKFVSIDDVSDDIDKSGNACFVLKADKGSVHVKDREPGTSGPVSETPVALSLPRIARTIDDYENVLHRAVAFISKEFEGVAENKAQAVAQVVTSYMAAYVRGDFAVPSDDGVPF
jgi:hypothetical protein